MLEPTIWIMKQTIALSLNTHIRSSVLTDGLLGSVPPQDCEAILIEILQL